MKTITTPVALQRGSNGKTVAEQRKNLGGVTGKGFKPGQSGNPTGKRKHSPSLRAALKRTATRADCEQVASQLVALAKSGDPRATRLLAELLGDLGGPTVAIGIQEQSEQRVIQILWPHETVQQEA